MIKFRAESPNGTILIGLGLSKANIEKLQQGDYMYFTLDELGIEGHEVTIIYGETEDDIKKELMKNAKPQ